MKTKVTRKDVYSRHTRVIRIGYCDASYLLYYEDAWAYNSGTYGWNYDVYSVGSVALCTGYRPIGERVNFDLLTEYDNKARWIVADGAIPHDEAEVKVKELLYKFIEEATK